tara:strand:+ start:147 stop:320 length:174 start_codon:yes stop_codon:yes gene_type:complete
MEHEPKPEHYIIVEEKDGTYSAFIRYANFDSKQDAEKGLQLVMDLMGFKLQPNITYH